jgi:hypothetical protein
MSTSAMTSSTAAAGIEQFAPVEFTLFVKRDPDNKLSGKCAAKIGPEGLVITPKGLPPITIAPGTDAKYLGQNLIAVPVPESGRKVHFSVVKRFGYQNNLALDVVAFLAGDIGKLRAADYRVAPWLYLAALLPFTVIAFMYWYGSTYQPDKFAKWGLEVPLVAGGLCLLLSLLCLVFLLAENTHNAVRVIACVSVTALGFLVAGWWLEAITLPRWFDEQIDEKTGVYRAKKEFDWKRYTYDKAEFMMSLPADPKPIGKRSVTLPDGQSLELEMFTCTDHNFAAEYKFEFGEIPKDYREKLFKDTAWLEELLKKDFPGVEEVKTEEIDPHKQAFEDGRHITLQEQKGKLPNGQHVLRHFLLPKNHALIFTVVYRPEDRWRHFVQAFFDDVRLLGFKDIALPTVDTGGGGGGGRPPGAGGPRGGRSGRGTMPSEFIPRRRGGSPPTATASAPTNTSPASPSPSAAAPQP